MENKWFTIIMIFLSLFFIAIISYATPTQIGSFIANTTASSTNVTFNETALNDTSTEYNITFTAKENRTTYISIPKNSGVTNAKLNLSGYVPITLGVVDQGDTNDLASGIAFNGTHYFVMSRSEDKVYVYNTSWDEQYNFDVFTESKYSLDVNDTVVFIPEADQPGKVHLYLHDGTYVSNFSLGIIEPAYPRGIYVNDTYIWLWGSDEDIHYYLHDGTYAGYINLNWYEGINYALTGNGTHFWIGGSYDTFTIRRYNADGSESGWEKWHTGVSGLDFNGTHFFSCWAAYDRCYVHLPIDTYPNNVSLDIGGDGDWDWTHDGEFNETYSPNETSDLSSEINAYLSTCSDDPCDVPLVHHSDVPGDIQDSAINVTYNYNVTYLFTEDDNSGNYYYNQTTEIVAGSEYKKHFKVTNTSNTTTNDISITGYYLKNQTATACCINETEYTPTGSPKYCPLSFSLSSGENWLNHNISDRSGIAVTISEGSYSQDPTNQTEAGATNYSFITSTITLSNPADTGESLAGTFSQAVRSGWTCDLGCSGTFSAISDGGSTEKITNQSKLNVVTKTEAETVIDTEFQSELLANTSINSNVQYYYWNTTLEINNTDDQVNYTNVRWYNYLTGADFDYAQNVSGGNLTEINYTSPTNVTSRFRTPSVTTEEVVTDTGSAYEKDIDVTCPDSVDAAFVSNNYRLVKVNVTTSTEYTSYDFYWWNGVAWEKHTETVWYNFTTATDYSWASFKTNCSTNYYAISSETPEYQPPAENPPGGAGSQAEPVVLIISGNWSILQPNFYLLAAPGSEVMSYITIDNKRNTEIEYVNLTCIPSTCRPDDACSCVDLCPYVTFGAKLVQIEGKPFFQVYQIPPGQSGKAPFYVNFTSAYAQDHNLPEIQPCFYTFSIKVTIDEISHPVNVQVIALPGMEQIGKALTWLERRTLIIPGKYPIYIDNWLLLVIAIIVVILLFVGIVKMLR